MYYVLLTPFSHPTYITVLKLYQLFQTHLLLLCLLVFLKALYLDLYLSASTLLRLATFLTILEFHTISVLMTPSSTFLFLNPPVLQIFLFIILPLTPFIRGSHLIAYLLIHLKLSIFLLELVSNATDLLQLLSLLAVIFFRLLPAVANLALFLIMTFHLHPYLQYLQYTMFVTASNTSIARHQFCYHSCQCPRLFQT
jgi:hypothetical protein